MRFSYSLYIRKSGPKWVLNSHKMAKNAPNELKFWPDMYFYGFYQILKDFWKIFKIGWFLAVKPSFSAFFASWFWNFFSTENVTGPSKMLRFGWKSVYLLPIMCLTKVVMGFGWFQILVTLCAFKVAEMADFWTKNGHFAHFARRDFETF